ncbi:hypothetical protein ABMA27_008713 [Loxostege sticticalis]|uniref:non-specific serine/threonine protein kinase n=1 Tax=Loxostege sticticalis TaxID=481309 RepID=A0ABR3HCD1_LOXSC
MEGSNSKESLSCAGCLNDIGNDDYVSALGQDWHKDCFRCSVCDVALSSWYFEKAGLLFCQNDYWARFGESCQQCAQVITGPVMSAGEHRFHPECFACVCCGAHIEDGEPYALVERSSLYCGSCYARSARARAPAIRVLDVPARALRVQPRADALTVTEIDSSCGLLTLHIGDRILEINGTPVRSKPIEDIERVLARPAAVLQLTIEHNPDSPHITNNNNKPPDPEEKPKHDTKSPIERKIREDSKHIPDLDIPEHSGRKERLFKRKGEDGGRGRLMKRRQTPASPLLGDKERSSSMSKLLDVTETGSAGCEGHGGVLRDLSRARSFRAQPAPGQTVFRAADLLQGELLGSGFFGQVYKVTHRDTNEVMVLKQLYRVDDDAQRNFLKEVAVLRSLSHPNVLRFVGVLYKDKRLHLVTEYVPGGTLHHLIQDTSTPLSWRLRARLARDVAAGVGYLHRMNVIHRDLNSHNCLVREDKTVIVADFGLARIVQRTAASTLERGPHARTRKRYTVVGNPYWMAPEMMNGNVYDEKVDVFSFGIILCEIIGRVSADPDFLPRRSDFGLNESVFIDKFCQFCPEPFYRLAFLACHLDPDTRPSFEVMEVWLERLVKHLSAPAAPDATLLSDILQHAAKLAQTADNCNCDSCSNCNNSTDCNNCEENAESEEKTECAVVKSKSNSTLSPPSRAAALGKCVSATHICSRPTVTVTSHSRSHHDLHAAPGYILRALGRNINITKVDDITKWLDPPLPLKRSSPDSQLHHIATHKTRRVQDSPEHADLPAFLRNQSVEGLETQDKQQMPPPTFCRHHSIPDTALAPDDSDTSSDEESSLPDSLDLIDHQQQRNIFQDFMRRGENLLSKKSSYDVTDVTLRNPECLKGERKIPEEDYRRYNINHLTKSPIMAEGVKNIPKTVETQKQTEKTNFFTKKLLSPKLSRLFKPNSSEVVRNKPDIDEKEEKSRSKFFIQRPASPSNIRSYRVRPTDDGPDKKDCDVIKSDLKLASLGKPMTPIFRRHIPTARPEFADGRFSYRDRRLKPNEGKFVDMGRNKIKTPVEKKLTPLIRSSQMNNIPALATVVEKKDGEVKKREAGISRSNYVSLANLRINGKEKVERDKPPLERVI